MARVELEAVGTQLRESFRRVYLYDSEYNDTAVICWAAMELFSGEVTRLWGPKLDSQVPFDTGPGSLFVCYNATAECGSHLRLGWPLPVNVLDLFVEFRQLTNGRPEFRQKGATSLLGALKFFSLPSINLEVKEHWRNTIINGAPYSAAVRAGILDYCWSDVEALTRLLPAMWSHLDLPYALRRGRFMPVVSAIEHRGIPLNKTLHARLVRNWQAVRTKVLDHTAALFPVFEDRVLKRALFERWLGERAIEWPRTPGTRQLRLRDEDLRNMAQLYPELEPIREARELESQLRTLGIPLDEDGRSRPEVRPFIAITGRNQPSSKKFLFHAPVWLRSLAQPPAGRALAYVDYEQQEWAIAGVLSGDPGMLEAYQSGDPYLDFARRNRAIPADGTKQSHPVIRERYKTVSLATLYGQGAQSLAIRLGISEIAAQKILTEHERTYRRFWEWIRNNVLGEASWKGWLSTNFGWRYYCGHAPSNPRSVMNFPMQAHGSEILREACCLAHQQGIAICATVHDAVLIEASVAEIEETVAATQHVMQAAGQKVLSGFQLRTEAKIIRHPEHFVDPRGAATWAKVTDWLGELESTPAAESETKIDPQEIGNESPDSRRETAA